MFWGWEECLTPPLGTIPWIQNARFKDRAMVQPSVCRSVVNRVSTLRPTQCWWHWPVTSKGGQMLQPGTGFFCRIGLRIMFHLLRGTSSIGHLLEWGLRYFLCPFVDIILVLMVFCREFVCHLVHPCWGTWWYWKRQAYRKYRHLSAGVRANFQSADLRQSSLLSSSSDWKHFYNGHRCP